jgi:hypothetical protein
LTLYRRHGCSRERETHLPVTASGMQSLPGVIKANAPGVRPPPN